MFFNSNQGRDKKDMLMRELNNLQEAMSENIEKVLQNEEKVELVVKKTSKVVSIADDIKNSVDYYLHRPAKWKRKPSGNAISACLSSC